MAVSAAVSTIDTTSTRKLDESTRIRNGKGMNMAKIKVKSPAEVLYNQQNPLFSTRTRPEVMTAEQKMMLTTGMNRRDLLESIYLGQNEKFNAAVNKKVEEKVQLFRADILEEGKRIGRAEISASVEEKSKKISEEQEWIMQKIGFYYCLKKHAVVVWCEYCKQQIILSNDMPEMQRFQQWMQRQGFMHPNCYKEWLFKTGQITWEDLPGYPPELKTKPPGSVRIGQSQFQL